MIRSLRPWLTRLYPKAWRERYEAKEGFDHTSRAMLDIWPLDVLDVLYSGAVDAHLLLFSGESLNWRCFNVLETKSVHP